MKIKAIIITMFFIGAFFSGSALAATMGAATSDFSDQNMRDVAADGQRGVQEQESRPGYTANCETSAKQDWGGRSLDGQNGVAEQNPRFAQNMNRESDEQRTQGYFATNDARCRQDFPSLREYMRPSDGA